MSSDEPAKREALKPREYVKRCDVIVFCYYHLLFVCLFFGAGYTR